MPVTASRIRNLKAGDGIRIRIVEMCGDADETSGGEVQSSISQADAPGISGFVVDLKDVGELSLGTAESLLDMQKSFQKSGTFLTVSGLNHQIEMDKKGRIADRIPHFRDEGLAVQYLVDRLTENRTHSVRHVGDSLKESDKENTYPFGSEISQTVKESEGVLALLEKADTFSHELQQRFEDVGRKYRVSHSCSEARKLIQTFNPALLIIDGGVPGVQNFVKEVKEDSANAWRPIHYFKQEVDSLNRELLNEKGTDQVWSQPVNSQKVFLESEKMLSGNKLRRLPRCYHMNYSFRTTDWERKQAEQIGSNIIDRATGNNQDTIEMKSAFLEAVDNAVRHGNKYKKHKEIRVSFLLTNTCLSLLVEDEGDGFDYETYLRKAKQQTAKDRYFETVENGKSGGLGIMLMYEATDDICYVPPGNTLLLAKDIF